MSTETLLINGHLLDPTSRIEGVRHLAIRDGRIADVSEKPFDAERLQQAEVIDAAGKWVMPGFIDLHVHFREPGEEYKETILSGSRAAVAGGFTGVVTMPNTRPVNDSVAVTELILRKAAEANLCRIYPAGAITKGQKGEELAEIGDLVAAGCCAITDDGRPVMNGAIMRRALEYAKAFNIPVMVHEEDLHLAGDGVMNEGPIATRLGLEGIPNAAEEVMVARDIQLAELTGGRLHVAHMSTAGSARLVRDARRRGLKVTCEVTPHHFALTDSAVETYDTCAKMNPPLRSERDRLAIIEALADGTVDAIATDHAPHSAVEKDVEFDAAANGVIGLETALPLTLALVRGKLISPMRAAELLSSGPARIFNLPGGTLAPGSRADVTVVDPDAEWTCDPERFESKSRNTPFAGWKMRGQVKLTLVDGRVVYRNA